MISLIYNVQKQDDRVTVTAVVEDSKLVYSATKFDPPEYGPGLCESSFYLDDDEILPEDEDELIDYLEKLDLTWELVPDDNDYYGDDEY
jgi:hypothetical protein